MEDRYLFKAKRLDNGEWIIGSLIQNPFFKGVRSWISSEQEDKTRLRSISRTQASWNSIEVDPSTICQCTAMPDKNKKLVFEHDIVWDSDERAFYEIIWDQEDMRWKVEDADGHKSEFEECYGSTIEVNGNIFDNPELLEGSYDD